MQKENGIQTRFYNEKEAFEWLSLKLAQKIGLPVEFVSTFFERKLRDMSVELVNDKMAFPYGYLAIEDSFEFMFPIVRGAMAQTVDKYIKGDVDDDLFDAFINNVEQNYKTVIAKYPFLEKIVFGEGLTKLIGASTFNVEDIARKAEIYFMSDFIDRYDEYSMSEDSLIFINYLLISTRSLNPSIYLYPDRPMAYGYGALLSALSLLWLVDPKEFYNAFKVYSPFEFESLEEMVVAYKNLAGSYATEKETGKKVSRCLYEIILSIKEKKLLHFLNLLNDFKYVVLWAMASSNAIWLRSERFDSAIDYLNSKKSKLFKKLKSSLYCDNYWHRLIKIADKHLKVEIGERELDLIEAVSSAVRNNRVANVDTAIKRYGKEKVEGSSVIVRKKRGREGILDAYIRRKSLMSVISEIEDNKNRLTEYNSLVCLFNLKENERLSAVFSSGYIPEEWRNKTLEQIIEEIFDKANMATLEREYIRKFNNSSQLPLSFRNFWVIISTFLRYYNTYGKSKFIDMFERFMDILYPAGYPYRGLRVWTFMLPMLLFMKYPELIYKIKCVGRKYGYKIANQVISLFSR